MAELQMRLVLAAGGRLQPIFHVSDSSCLEIHPCSRSSTVESRSFCKLADGDEGVSRPWGRMRLVLRQPVPPRCCQSPRGGEGWGTTSLAAEQIWEPGWSRAAVRRGQEPHGPSPEPGVTGFLVQQSSCLGKAGISDPSVWGF